MDVLNHLRQEIDALDRELIQLLLNASNWGPKSAK